MHQSVYAYDKAFKARAQEKQKDHIKAEESMAI
jgi:hypothetical protein